MPRKKKPIVFLSKDGTPYVKARDSGIALLVVLMDGLPLTFFGKEKTPYLTMQQVIDWHEKEIQYSTGKDRGYHEAAAAAFKRGLAKVQAGDVEFSE
jgi:hypothetical protein